ncbi:DUF2029 domain-containing protein [bacterium]|nr:MAG: DUF2029 domain-containing protein [bacterium]
MRSSRHRLTIAAFGVASIAMAIWLATFSLLSDAVNFLPHWDFKVYAAASDAFRAGKNPTILKEITYYGADIPYNYGPLFSRFFLPLFYGPRDLTEIGFVLVKIASVFAGCALLTRALRRPLWYALPMFALTGLMYGGALQLDFNAGNISGFEFLEACLLVWAVIERRSAVFIAVLTLLCLGKPTWIVFSILPAAYSMDRRAWKLAILSFVAVMASQGLSFALYPQATMEFIRQGAKWREAGFLNPCLRECFGDIARVVGIPTKITKLLYAATALLIPGGILLLRHRLAKRLGAPSEGMEPSGETPRQNPLGAIGLTLFLFMPAFMPRYKVYSYTLLVPFLFAALLLLPISWRARWGLALLAAFPFVYHFSALLSLTGYDLSQKVGILVAYLPCYLAILVAVLVLRTVLKNVTTGANPQPTSQASL